MLSFFLSSIPIIGKIVDAFGAYQSKKLDTALEKYKVDGKVDEALIAANVAVLQAQAQLLKNQLIVLLQVGFGLPLMIYFGKCILWDKVLALGSTDALGGDISTWAGWIVAFLFLHSAILGGGRKT